MTEIIPLADCEDRQLYEIRSRNLTVGAFRAATGGFIGIREKFNAQFLDEEYSWDPPHLGTAQAVRKLGVVVPEEILLAERLPGLVCDACLRPAEQYAGTYHGAEVYGGPPFYRHVDDPTGLDVCKAEGNGYGRAHIASNIELHKFIAQYTDWATKL